jgi:starch phosphorylase
MKVLVNGGLNLSELDGWWAEAWDPELGWALQNGHEHGPDAEIEAGDAEDLYRLLETEIIPDFYDRDARGIPLAWVDRIRNSMARLTTQFSTYRMVREYVERYYLPGMQRYQRRIAGDCALGLELQQWRQRIATWWPSLRFGNFDLLREGDLYRVELQGYLGDLTRNDVCVQLYADPTDTLPYVRQMLTPGEALSGAVHGYLYRGTVAADRAADAFTPRFVPMHPEALTPLEANQILWRE